MKAYHSIIQLCMLLTGFMYTLPVYAGGGDDHTHANEQPATSAVQEKYFASEASSARYELLLRYEPIRPGKPTHLTLFVSDFETNKPINDADMKITSQEDPTITFTIHQKGNGTYEVETTFPEKRTYSIAVNIDGSLGPDLLLLQQINAGEELPHPHESSSFSLLSKDNWYLLAIGLLGGLGLGFLFRRRNTAHGKAMLSVILVCICCSIPFQSSIAHGDDDHGADAAGNVFSNTVDIPKETQFLFDVYTLKVAKGSFTQSNSLFGTIIPSSTGQAIVTTPQNGTIVSVNAQVGKQVKAGQVIAIVEQSIDAGTQINIASERNNLTAEYDAAKKEMDRLNAIRDIAAKKDIDEATGRLQKAESNLALLKGRSGRTISLTAPISGYVGNFNMAIGTTVTTGQTLFTITNLSTLYVEAQVFDKDAESIRPDAVYTIEGANDNHKTSQIKLLAPAQEINSTNQSQKVLFQVDNPDDDLKIGAFVNIRVFASTASQQITLPNSAFSEINGKPVVFIKEAAEKYTVSYVQLGHNNGTHTSILKGINEGERAVINGSYQLKMIYLNQ